MAALDLIDETFILAAAERVAAEVASPQCWARLWPGLQVQLGQDRGAEGVRCLVYGDWIGTSEVWLQPHLDGVIAHYYLRVDPADRRLSGRRLARVHGRWARHAKRALWMLKDDIECGRPAGVPAEHHPVPGPDNKPDNQPDNQPDGDS